MREKGMTLREIAIYYALVIGDSRSARGCTPPGA